MAEIVNLRLARKRALRRDDAEKADANRIAFGMPKALRDKAERENRQAARALDGVRRGNVADPAGDAGSRASPPADEPS
ncbi:DUF4169 family protein [Aureimonas glaciei]|uniref:DUF4169 family protein n=1 Tax=Aureimonas glaciei TaxID=1776957 RepID=A0A916XYU9_9HYPH|nr:DUF4169 family protein [Aureimonas glaciei]GGD20383.1 hypothetical protein GCM10011335_24130 [Aureimonas glaciei]